MSRPALYSSLIVGLVGTVFIWHLGRLPLALGWWIGVAVGIVNFAFLVSGLQKSRDKNKKVPRQPFFFRYVILAITFFLILQMGQEQFGAALLGFGSYYMAMLVHYLVRLKKANPKP